MADKMPKTIKENGTIEIEKIKTAIDLLQNRYDRLIAGSEDARELIESAMTISLVLVGQLSILESYYYQFILFKKPNTTEIGKLAGVHEGTVRKWRDADQAPDRIEHLPGLHKAWTYYKRTVVRKHLVKKVKPNG